MIPSVRFGFASGRCPTSTPSRSRRGPGAGRGLPRAWSTNRAPGGRSASRTSRPKTTAVGGPREVEHGARAAYRADRRRPIPTDPRKSQERKCRFPYSTARSKRRTPALRELGVAVQYTVLPPKLRDANSIHAGRLSSREQNGPGEARPALKVEKVRLYSRRRRLRAAPNPPRPRRPVPTRKRLAGSGVVVVVPTPQPGTTSV